MLMLSISTDEQHTSRAMSTQNSAPSRLALCVAVHTPSPQPGKCHQPHVTTATALFSPSKLDFSLHPAAEFQQDRWTVFCTPCLRIQKLVHCPATGR